MNISKILEKRNMSKLQLAMKTGITPSDLYCALNGKKPFYPKYKRKISKYLGVDEATLFAESESTRNDKS